MKKWDLPKGWEWVSLGSTKHFVRKGGGTPSKSRPEYWDDGTVPWLSSTELDEKQVNIIKNTKLRITKKGIDNSSAEIVPKNSILLTCTASIGKVAINQIDLATNQQFNSFECKKGVLPKYVAYYLLTQKNNLIQLGGTTSFCHITIPSLSKIEIPMPPLETQHMIVAILDKAEEIKRLRAEAKVQTQKLIQSTFLDMFGDPFLNDKNWEMVTIKELIGNNGVITDGDWILSEDLKTGNDVRLIQLADIGDGEFLNKSAKFISKECAERLKCTYLKSGDILISRLSDPLMKTCILPNLVQPCITSVDVTILRPDEKLFNKKYLNCIFNSKYVKHQAMKYSAGSTRPRISRKNIERIEIPAPSIELQSSFSEYIEKIYKNIYLNYESYQWINTNFNTLIKNAFNGELVA